MRPAPPRPRHPARRRTAGLALALLAVVPLTACGAKEPDDVLEGFLAAVASGDLGAAADATDAPAAARATLTQVRTALAPESVEVTDRHLNKAGTSGTGTYRLTWRLPGGRQWSYASSAQVRSAQNGWQVHWQPQVVHPELEDGQSLAIRPAPAQLTPVLDRDGAPLLRPQPVVGVVVDPAQTPDAEDVATRLGSALHGVEPSLTGKSVLDGIKATKPGGSYSVLTLRASDYQRVKPAIHDLPGVRFSSQERLLPATRDTGRQVLPAVRSLVEQQAAGAAGWRVVSLDAGGGEAGELYLQAAKTPPPVTSTLSAKLQSAAEKALEPVPAAAALVAVQPSTGDLLAVAQNDAADEQGSLALAGRFPPGSTFKIVTAAAALSAGSVRADSPVDCPGTATFANRTVPNEGEFALGSVPLSTAFARSCNTTFARLATDLPPAALTDSARALGVGADFVVPGLTTVTGSVPPAETVAQRAENAIGQGTVVASPFGMALAAAAVQSGRVPVPSLVRGQPGKASGTGLPPRQEVLDALRGMMRDVVTEGTATGLRDLPDVHGKTGTAQFGDGTHAHGWFVGYTGDLAFAVLLTDAGSSKPAVEAAHRFLKSGS
ncbi:penicillin-binding transpeptidase domain-containing protein [Amycolatopsis sp. NPDC059021]|uniref:penicillin-binding transpeptidase domain-containing protein n=1 Tax=Amycolatopsis sp. NPDC059021 TaxID=3346704 RepID=UPI0036700AAF